MDTNESTGPTTDRPLAPLERQPGRVDDVQLRALVSRRVSGWTLQELADAYGYTVPGMRGLLASDRAKALLEVQQARIAEAGTRALAKFQLAAEDIAAKVVARARDENDDKCWEAQRYVLDAILPQRSQVVSETNVVFNQQTNNVLVSLGETLSGLKEVLGAQHGGADFETYLAEDGEGLELPAPHVEGQAGPGRGPNGGPRS